MQECGEGGLAHLGGQAAGAQARDILVGVSGASGMALAASLLRLLAGMPWVRVHCVVSQGARAVLQAECGAGPASGSWWRRGAVPAAMLVAPCSMGTLGALASGATRNLLQRAADVALKERLTLVLVTRESPLSAVHLRNMLTLQEAGAVIMPFSPGFYLRPQTLDELLRQSCGRIFDQLGLPHRLGRWGEALAQA